MGRILSQYPNQRFATSGEAALRLAREATPDLIVMDVDMPGMTGLDVCEALRADPALSRVPVILATSHDATTLLQVAAFQRGATDFLTKPLIAAQLTARVRAHLRAKQQMLRQQSLSAMDRFGSISPQLRRVLSEDSNEVVRGHIENLQFSDAAKALEASQL